ncbi:MAG: T9SS type A sorting domain-containing protein [bacterium]
MKGTVAVISLVLLFGASSSGIPVAGILETGNLTVQGDSVIWFLTSAPGPIVEQTPNWGGGPGTVDSIQFAPKSEWPSRVEFYYRAQGIPSHVTIDPLLPDTWYDLPTYLGFQTPKVRFEDDSITGISEFNFSDTKEQFSILPNPTTTGNIRIVGPGLGSGINFTLYDISGKPVVVNQSITRSGEINLNLNGLPRGAYLLRLQVNGKGEKHKLLFLN